jgi:hypothetical protein
MATVATAMDTRTKNVQTTHSRSSWAGGVFVDAVETLVVGNWIGVTHNAAGIDAIGFYDDDLMRTAESWRSQRRLFTQVRIAVTGT